MKKILSFLLALSLTVTMIAANVTLTASAADLIKVACVGDSITQGASEYNYPMYLQAMLGSGYEVKNFGKGGSAVKYAPESDGTYFWYGSSQYQDSLNYDADYVFVMMGTNDVKNDIDSYYDNDYYNYLIKPYLDNGSQVIIMTSPTAEFYLFADVNVINTTIRQHQIDLAAKYGLSCIDMNTATKGMPECFPDGLHGNSSGYMVIAQTIYKEYFGGTTHKLSFITEPDTAITLAGANTGYGTYNRNADENTGKVTVEVVPDTYDIYFRNEGFVTTVYEDIKVNGNSSYVAELKSGRYTVSTDKAVSATGSSISAVNDGDDGTMWKSEENNVNECVTVDLGAVDEKLCGVRINWGGAYASKYSVQLSENGTDFETVADITDGKTGEREIIFDGNKKARYIRIYCNGFSGKNTRYEIYEFEVLSQNKVNPVGGINYALNCTMSADSSKDNTSPVSAADGDTASFWRSGKTGENADNAAYLQVDLGAQTTVDSAIIRWTESSATTSGYKIQYSTDGKAFTNVANQRVERKNKVDTCRFNSVKARYIKVYITAVDTKVSYPSIYELEIYNSDLNGNYEQTVNYAFSASAFDGNTGNYSNRHVPSAAIDGDLNTGWQANGNVNDGNIFLGVDLGSQKNIGSVNIHFEAATRCKKGGYVIQYSNDNVTWTAVKGADYTYGDAVDTVYFDVVDARYVRILCNTGKDSKYCPKIWEFEVFNGYIA